MCGIIGISSNKPVSANIINSLKKLEYRGYDSAGIATLSNNEIKEIKSNNNISALFYDKKRKVQIRMSGKAVLHENSDELKTIWSTMKPESKLCYMGPFAPGEKLDQFQPNLPDHSPQNISTKNIQIVEINHLRTKDLILS
mgnify:CR=1 FL=1